MSTLTITEACRAVSHMQEAVQAAHMTAFSARQGMTTSSEGMPQEQVIEFCEGAARQSLAVLRAGMPLLSALLLEAEPANDLSATDELSAKAQTLLKLMQHGEMGKGEIFLVTGWPLAEVETALDALVVAQLIEHRRLNSASSPTDYYRLVKR